MLNKLIKDDQEVWYLTFDVTTESYEVRKGIAFPNDNEPRSYYKIKLEDGNICKPVFKRHKKSQCFYDGWNDYGLQMVFSEEPSNKDVVDEINKYLDYKIQDNYSDHVKYYVDEHNKYKDMINSVRKKYRGVGLNEKSIL